MAVGRPGEQVKASRGAVEPIFVSLCVQFCKIALIESYLIFTSCLPVNYRQQLHWQHEDQGICS